MPEHVPTDPDQLPQPGPGATVLAAIAAGGAMGALARYGVSRIVHVPPNGFPWATFWTNVSGSFVLGLVLVLVVERFPPTRYVRPFFAVGFLGAYTTFSTMAVESDLLAKHGHAGTAFAYLALSVVVGLAAVTAGIAAGRTVPVGQQAAG